MTINIDISIISNIKELGAIEYEWNTLLDNNPEKTVFQTFQWTYNVVRSFHREKGMCILTMRKGGKLIGIIPLRSISRDLRLFKYRVLEFLTRNRSDYQDIIIKEYREECLASFINFLRRNYESWDILFLDQIPLRSDNLNLVIDIINFYGLSYKIIKGVVCPVIEIDGSFEDYIRGRRRLVYDIRRCQRRLGEKGSLSLVRFSGEAPLSSIAEKFIQQHIERWGRTETPSKFNKIEHREYFRLLLQGLYDQGFLDLFYLKLNDNIIAYHFGTKYNYRVLYHTPSFDPSYSKYSPSKILLLHVIEQCFNNKMDCFDFLAGAEDYKLNWTKKVNETVKLFVFRNKFAKLKYELFFSLDAYKFLDCFKKPL